MDKYRNVVNFGILCHVYINGPSPLCDNHSRWVSKITISTKCTIHIPPNFDNKTYRNCTVFIKYFNINIKRSESKLN